MLAPENTAVAFDVALGFGAHVLETDVRLSRDGVVFVTHDQTLERTTDGRGNVRDHLASELLCLNAGYHFYDLEGRSYRHDGIRLMRLDDLLEQYSHCGINIDIKDSDAEAATAVADVIARHPEHGDVNVGSFNGQVLAHFRQAAPGTSTAATRAEVADLYFGRLWPRRAEHNYRYLQIPTRYGPFVLANKRLIHAATTRDVKVVYWTINEARQMQSLLDLGAHGIVTDRPDIAATLPVFKSEI